MAISGRQLRFRREYHVIQPGSARFPRRFAPRNDKLGSLVSMNLCRKICKCTRRSLSAATVKFDSDCVRRPIAASRTGLAVPASACQKSPFGPFSPSCFQNCKIKFCSMILQFCRCGGLFDAKGNPDGFLSHYPSLRNFRLSRFLTVWGGACPAPTYFTTNFTANSAPAHGESG